MTNNIKKIIIATGGTGGHVFPAYSLAKHFNEKKIKVEIVTDERGLRYLNNSEKFKIIKIPSSTFFGKNILRSFLSIFFILYSILKSFVFLLFNRPTLIFGMGGYSSFPICITAFILRIPFIIYENNLHIGKANRYLLPYTKRIFVSFRDLEGIPKKFEVKIIQVGNIIRKEIFNFKDLQRTSNKDKKLKILILGGSQAAKVFAEKLPEVFKKCKSAKINLKVYQQCLPEQNEILASFYRNLDIDFEIFNFSKNIFDYFSKINFVITRSGSSMLAELINAKIPFISVPLPSSADNHQLKNAIYYEKNQYSYLIEEKYLNEKLFELIKKIDEDRTLLDQLIVKQKGFSDKNVYMNIDKEMDKIINEKH